MSRFEPGWPPRDKSMKSALATVPERMASPNDAVDLAGLFRSHARYVAGVAMRLLGNDAEIDDVVQDVFIAAGPMLQTLREPLAIRGWLATIAVRTAGRRLRWRKLRRMVSFGDITPTERPMFSSEVPADDRVLLQRVYAMLDRVPTAERIAWTLRYIEGEQLEDVARLCECSLATAKRRIAAVQERITKEFSDG